MTVDPNGIRQGKHSTKEVNDELIRRRFITDYRPPTGIRVAPHFYNTMEEVDAVIDEMKKYETGIYSNKPGRWENEAKSRPDVAASKLKPPTLLYRTFRMTNMYAGAEPY